MGKVVVILVLVGVWCLNGAVGDGITVSGTKCGQKTCKTNEFCSAVHFTCEDCGDGVCDSTSHNYEEAVCEKQCQNYLHDLRYVTKSGSDDGDLRATVDRLSRMITVTLSLVILLILILLCLLGFQLYRWKVKKNITFAAIRNKFFKKSDPERETAPNPPSRNNKRDLKLEMPSTTARSDHSPVTVSTSIDRRPAEDSTLDYAYDNPAMNKSPNSSY